MAASSAGVDDVFGISRGVPRNYVARTGVDGLFSDSLTRGQHLVVFGSSKQGKTSLRKSCLQEDQYVVVTCSNTWTDLAQLHTAILKAAGYVVEQSATRTVAGTHKVTATIEGKIRIPLLGHGKGASSGGYQRHTERGSTRAPLELDPSDVNDIVAALGQIVFNKYIVLEDFHYLPDVTQGDFAVALKAFHENSRLCFIIVGVWLDENRLIQLNGDLAERVIPINVDAWSRSELNEVVDLGARLLNVDFDSSFKFGVIAYSFSSVSVVQMACHDACVQAGVLTSQPSLVVVGRGLDARRVVGDVIAKQSARYGSFLRRFAAGFEETRLDLYRWLLLPMLMAEPAELRKGLSFEHIQRTISGYHPTGAVSPGAVRDALYLVAQLQQRMGIKPIILDYDHSMRRLNIVDRGFLIWLDRESRPDLLNDMELPQYPRLAS